MLCKS